MTKRLNGFTDIESIEGLKDGSEDIRAAAIALLGERSVDAAGGLVMEIAMDPEEDPFVQRQALFYFESLSDLDSLGILLRSAPDVDVRSEAIDVIARMNHAAGDQLIAAALDDPAWRVRKAAKRALRRVG